MEDLCKPDTLNIILRSKSFEGQTTDVEEWYSTKYSVAPFSDELKKKIISPACPITSKKLDLPPANNLIPKNFDILAKNEEQSALPKLIGKDWNDTDLWYKKDDKFERPKASVNLKFYTQDCDLGLNADSRIFVNVW
jgi:insulysin